MSPAIPNQNIENVGEHSKCSVWRPQIRKQHTLLEKNVSTNHYKSAQHGIKREKICSKKGKIIPKYAPSGVWIYFSPKCIGKQLKF